MARSLGKRRRYDDHDDFDARSIRKKGNPALTLLAVGGIGGVLLLCLLACGIGTAVALLGDSTASKLPGKWKGDFVMGARPLDVTYTFNSDGTFREETIIAGRANIADGRWRYHNGEIEINWNRGTFEKATATWIDNNTMDYRIVDHTQAMQKGLKTTFRRQ